MAVLTDFLTGIANKLRSNLGTSDTINASQFGTKIDEVYAKSTYNWWKSFTNNGAREYYEWAFRDSDLTGQIVPSGLCKPKYTYGMFFGYKGTAFPTGIDFSRLSLTDSDSGNQTFAGINGAVIPDMGVPAFARYGGTYSYSYNLETIAKIRTNENTLFASPFTSCPNLKNITIEGTIGQNGITFKDCPLLTATSLNSIIGALSHTATGVSITFNPANVTTYDAVYGAGAWDYELDSNYPNWTVGF